MNDSSKTDHDLLIEISTTLKRAVSDIRDLKDGLDSRVGILEEHKADKKDIEDIMIVLRGSDGENGLIKKVQESRDNIESLKGTIFKVYIPILTAVIGFIVYLLINHILGK